VGSWAAILLSWGQQIAWEYRQINGYQLKIMQEIITLVVLVGFASLVLRGKLR
jgi:uncharacterized protein (DUF486 family)